MTRTPILQNKEYAEIFLHIANNQGISSSELMNNLTFDERHAKTTKLQNLKNKGYINITKIPGKFGRISKYKLNEPGLIEIIYSEFFKTTAQNNLFKTEKNLLIAIKGFVVWAAKTKNDLTIHDLLEGFILDIGRMEDAGVLTQKNLIVDTYGYIPPDFIDLCEQYFFDKFGNNQFWKLYLC